MPISKIDYVASWTILPNKLNEVKNVVDQMKSFTVLPVIPKAVDEFVSEAAQAAKLAEEAAQAGGYNHFF